jgi:REP element-mobilizing transposase RayT
MTFDLFDSRQPYAVLWRHLPHWEQPGATYFITWRTADSLPVAVLQAWITERDEWFRRHGLPVVRSLRDRTSGHSVTGPRVPEPLRANYRAFVAERWEAQLDRCEGECLLRRPELAEIVADSLLHFDGERYAMGDFVVMPNHAHLLVCLPGEDQLLRQCRSWKKFTATRINKRLGRRGEFWQDESFDHLVRSPDELERFRLYIAENPCRANLCEGEYIHHRGPVTP